MQISLQSSFISSLIRIPAKTKIVINNATPPRGVTVNQLMIGAITYAVISRAPRNMIMINKSMLNINLIHKPHF